ncbi:hypothetical protein SAMN05660284_01101 [Formivibrio citricus]|uniref:Uncharacterized protein n=1 Tax=Formivibrio citricus TaxID=83765 RepID=A0A1I4XUX8_9NEIS|nr:hypothetical protein SAMN05660284_01101 [Formivibrio citricus]
MLTKSPFLIGFHLTSEEKEKDETENKTKNAIIFFMPTQI